MNLYYSVPTFESSLKHANNGISQVVIGMGRYMPAHGWQPTENAYEASLHCHHAGEGKGATDVAICHGLHPTASYNMGEAINEVNRLVLMDIIAAKHVVVPSQWVADILRREMKLEPHVVSWGIDLDFWKEPADTRGNYVLWNKNRADPVCDPNPMQYAAAKLPQYKFLTTFGKQRQNVTVIGRQPWERMTSLVKKAAVYLATTRETGDIGSREALAAGVPVVAFRWGATPEVVQHGVNGFLAEPGDIEGLAAGIEYCMIYRDTLSENARFLSQDYSWDIPAKKLAAIFDVALNSPAPPYTVSVVIPCYNYAKFVDRAIRSVQAQNFSQRFEIVVVDDCSADASWEIIQKAAKIDPCITALRNEANRGVAFTRNRGVMAAKGKYVLTLDADDQIMPDTLRLLVEAMEDDPFLGIAYGELILEHTGQPTGFPPDKCDYEAFTRGYNQVPTCAMFRRADYLRTGGYRAYMQPAEDADLFLRLISYTGKAARKVTKQPTLVYNSHRGSLSNSHYEARGQVTDPFRERGQIIWNIQRPIAAPVNGKTRCNPVRYYDQPIIKVRLVGDGDQQITLDSLELQTFWQWTLTGNAPFEVEVEAGKYLLPNALENWLATVAIKEQGD